MIIIRKIIVLGILLFVLVGVFVYGVNLFKKSDKTQEEINELNELSASDEQVWETILSQAAWDLIEGNVSGLRLAQKMKEVNLSNYQIFSVEPYEGWTSGGVTVGKVHIIMMNRETRNYDWLSFSLLVKENQLMDASLITPDYYKGLVPSHDQPEKVTEFIASVFDDMNINHFGYRYRTHFQTPDFHWILKDQRVIAQAGPVYLVEVQYGVEYIDQKKDLTALLIVRDYQGKKLQIEDMKVL